MIGIGVMFGCGSVAQCVRMRGNARFCALQFEWCWGYKRLMFGGGQVV